VACLQPRSNTFQQQLEPDLDVVAVQKDHAKPEIIVRSAESRQRVVEKSGQPA
jgi:hypothetical protein